MPFCRKCGRYLPQYSESCAECGTSTTATLIKIKKASAPRVSKAITHPKPVVPVIPVVPATVFPKRETTKSNVSKVLPAPATKPAASAKMAEASPPSKEMIIAKPIEPAKVYPPHEIIKSKVSIEEDVLANPQDYETQTFTFDLACSNEHFWPAGKTLPVSNGKAFCPQCGERLRKPKKQKRRYRRF